MYGSSSTITLTVMYLCMWVREMFMYVCMYGISLAVLFAVCMYVCVIETVMYVCMYVCMDRFEDDSSW